jgi:hypothetical protein
VQEDSESDDNARLADIRHRQMARLQSAAKAQGLVLAPGWRVDVRVRKNGTSKGMLMIHQRLLELFT